MNLLCLIDAFCSDDFLMFWGSYCTSRGTCDNSTFKDAQKAFLGFVPSSHIEYSNSLNQMIRIWREIKAGIEKQESVQESEAFSQSFHVVRVVKSKKKPGDNTFYYSINDIDFRICSISHRELSNASVVLELIEKIKFAILERNRESLRVACSFLGEEPALRIVLALMKPLLADFVKAEMWNEAWCQREFVMPQKVLFGYFGKSAVVRLRGQKNEALESVITAGMKEIPQIKEMLVAGNSCEILVEKPCWKMYYTQALSFKKWEIRVDCGTEGLSAEMREYLRHLAKKVGGDWFLYTNDKYSYCTLFTRALNALGIKLNSFTELSEVNCLAIQSYLTQEKQTPPSVIKRVIHEMNHLYAYVARQKGVSKKSPVLAMTVPTTAQITNPEEPIPIEMMIYIEERLHLVPVVVRLIYKCSKITGARLQSIFELTTDDLFFQNGKLVIRVINWKTEKRNVKNGRCSEVRHIVEDDDIAKEFLQYIKETEHLRATLDKPYLFVVNEPTRHKDAPTARCRPSYFNNRMKSLLKDAPFRKMDGKKFWFSFRSMRAAVGADFHARGLSAHEKLGNTPAVAVRHYNTKTPAQEAALYDRHYTAAFAKVNDDCSNSKSVIPMKESGSVKVPYGECESKRPCGCLNDCESCDQLCVKRK